MYDLPVVMTEDRREYYHFKKKLRQNGFLQMQESCYLKLIRNVSAMETTIRSLSAILPKHGNVSVLQLSLTDFKGIRCLLGEPFPIDMFTDDIIAVGNEDEDCA